MLNLELMVFQFLFRFDRNRFGERGLIYVREGISCKELIQHKLPENIEGLFIEINLRKQKFLLFGGYRFQDKKQNTF